MDYEAMSGSNDLLAPPFSSLEDAIIFIDSQHSHKHQNIQIMEVTNPLRVCNIEDGSPYLAEGQSIRYFAENPANWEVIDKFLGVWSKQDELRSNSE